MKKKDESNKGLVSNGEGANMSQRNSANAGRMSYDHNGPNSQDDENINEFRHGYGIQYWTDGAHYEGQWYFNKAEG